MHELAHANNRYLRYVSPSENTFYIPRVGFCLPQNELPWGWFLEEGWADMHRGNYFAENASEEERRKLIGVLRYGDVRMEDTIPVYNISSRRFLPIPIKYLYLTSDGKPTFKSSSYAAYGLELLCKINPEIKDLLFEGRKSIEGLRMLAKIIDKIQPGLYRRLQMTDYTEEDFAKKLHTVISYLRDKSQAVSASTDFLRNKWTPLLSDLF